MFFALNFVFIKPVTMNYSNRDSGFFTTEEDYFEQEWQVPVQEMSLRMYQGYNVDYIQDEIAFFNYNPLYTFPKRLFNIENATCLRIRILNLCDLASWVSDYPIVWVGELAKLFRREVVSLSHFYRVAFGSSIETEIEHYKEEYNEKTTMRSLVSLITSDGHLETRILVTYFALEKWLRILTFEYKAKFSEEFHRASVIKCPADWDRIFCIMGDDQDEGIA